MLSNANHLGHDSYQSHIGCLTKGQVRLKFELSTVNAEHIDGLPMLSHLRQPCSLSHSLLNWSIPHIFFVCFSWFRANKAIIGALSIFFSWMSLVLFIRKFPKLGIYVVMFTSILYTFMKFFIIYVLFIVAFGLAFYTLLDDKQVGKLYI